ncbi:hypothetical protein [Microcystis phage Me-ZS1]|nr:hypothetical protein [Microcystis phage Me-ZS1]
MPIRVAVDVDPPKEATHYASFPVHRRDHEFERVEVAWFRNDGATWLVFLPGLADGGSEPRWSPVDRVFTHHTRVLKFLRKVPR